MSRAEELLNTLDDGGVALADETGEGYIVINDDRTITVPESLKRLGVQYDHNIETVTFRCPRYWDGNDMSEMKIYINYLRADGVKGQYLATNVKVSGDTMTFDWVVSNNVTRAKGTIVFLVCIVKTNEDGLEEQHWNSELNQSCYISEGMECQETMAMSYPDIITHLLLRMEETESVASTETVEKVTNTWLTTNRDQLLAEIDGKANAALETIPGDYTETYQLAQDSVRTRANAIVSSVDGAAVAAYGISDDYLRNLQVYGRTAQTVTTGKNLFDLTSALANQKRGTTTVSDYYAYDNGVQVKSNSYDHGRAYIHLNLTAGTYTISADVSVKSNWNFSVKNYDTGIELINETMTAPTDGRIHVSSVFTLDADALVGFCFMSVVTGGPATTATNIQLEVGEAEHDYEPYSGGFASPSPNWPQDLNSISDNTVSIYGANLIPYPYTNAAQTLHGITYTVDADGSVTATGTTTQGTNFYFAQNLILPKGRYSLWRFGDHTGGGLLVYNGTSVLAELRDGELYKEFEITKDDERINVYLNVPYANYVLKGTIRPMITTAGIDEIDYEPYKAVQKLTLPYTLHGIPVSKGGNYTDENGQQWICDEVDLFRGVYIQRVGHLTIDDSMQYFYNTDNYFLHTGSNLFDNVAAWETRIRSTHFMPVGNGIDIYDYGWFQFNGNGGIRFRIEGIDDTSALATWLSTNTPEVIYPYVTPVEHPLTATEINLFKWTRGNYPITTVLNTANAHMELRYNADTLMFLRDNQPQPDEEQINSAVKDWLNDNPPDSDHPVTSVNGMTGDVVIEMPSGGTGVSSWNDLTDKPFYEEPSDIAIEWDGSIEGREIIDAGQEYYKVSDLTPTTEELGRATWKLDSPFTISSDDMFGVTGAAILGGEMVIVAYDTTVALDSNTVLNFPSTGVYFCQVDMGYVLQRFESLTYNGTTISWNGDVEGRDSASIEEVVYYKVSDLTPTADELIGGSACVTVIYSGSIFPVEDIPGARLISEGNTGIVVYDAALFEATEGIACPGNGLYLPAFSDGPVTISYRGNIVHRLDAKFLPEGGFGWEEVTTIEPLTAEYEIDYAGADQVDVSGDGSTILSKIGDQIIEFQALIGAQVKVTSGLGEVMESFTITSDDALNVGDMYAFFVGDMTVYFIKALNVQGIEFPSTGVYIEREDALDGYMLTIEVAGSSTSTIHKINEKFIPDSIARKDDISGGGVDIPTTLPNPNKLIFSGLAGGEYDGSEQVTVDIPAVAKDWNQSDESADDYIKNRTHYSVESVTEWFGGNEYDLTTVSIPNTTTGSFTAKRVQLYDGPKELIESGREYEIMIGDEVFTATCGGSETVGSYQYSWIGNPNLSGLFVGMYIPSTDDDYLFITGYTSSLSNGKKYEYYYMWFYTTRDVTRLKLNLKYTDTYVKTLDEKFIPTSIARISDIPEVNYPVTSVNGMTGDIIIETSSSGADTAQQVLKVTVTGLGDKVSSHSPAEIKAAYDSGAIVYLVVTASDSVYYLQDAPGNSYAYFGTVPAVSGHKIYLNWLKVNEDKTVELNGTTTFVTPEYSKEDYGKVLKLEGDGTSYGLNDKLVWGAPAAAISDLTAAPTTEDFNILLASLRAAGYLASE